MAPALTNQMKAYLDFFFKCSIVAPSVVLQWWTIWSLLDRFLGQEDESNMSLEDLQKLAMKDPENMVLQEQVSLAWESLGSQMKKQLKSLAAGLMAKILLDILQPFLGGWLVNKSSLLQLAGGRIFNTMKTTLLVWLWWSVFNLCDNVQKFETLKHILYLCAIVSFILLVCLRLTPSLTNTPVSVTRDSHDETFRSGNYEKKEPSSGLWSFLGDVFLSNLVLRPLTIVSWWAVWTAYRYHLLESDLFLMSKEQFALVSLGLGYSLTFLSFAAPKHQDDDISTWARLSYRLLQLAASLLAFAASLVVWVGLWTLCDLHLKVQHDTVILVSCLLGVFLLHVFGFSNTAGCDTLEKDVEAPNRDVEVEEEKIPLLLYRNRCHTSYMLLPLHCGHCGQIQTTTV